MMHRAAVLTGRAAVVAGAVAGSGYLLYNRDAQVIYKMAVSTDCLLGYIGLPKQFSMLTQMAELWNT